MKRLEKTFTVPRSAKILGVEVDTIESMVEAGMVIPERRRGPVPLLSFRSLSLLRQEHAAILAGIIADRAPESEDAPAAPAGVAPVLNLRPRLAARALAERHCMRGNLELHGLGAVDAATEAYNAALDADPHYMPAFLGFGRVRLVEKKLDEAETFFRKAMAMAPGEASPRALLGMVYLRRGAVGKATWFYEHSLALDASNPDVLAYGRFSAEVGVPALVSPKRPAPAE